MKFEIIAGRQYSADFTVVSDDGVTGEVLDPTDTATFTISTNGEHPVTVIDSAAMTIVDANNGLFNITLSELQTAELIQDVGFAEDKYPTVSNYTGVADFNLVSGDRFATVPVYVREV